MDQPYDVDLTARAAFDLLAVRRWLSQPGSGLRARLRLARINRALVELQYSPQRWPFGPHVGVRQRLVEGYYVCYRVHDVAKVVTILRVFGPHQDRSRL